MRFCPPIIQIQNRFFFRVRVRVANVQGIDLSAGLAMQDKNTNKKTKALKYRNINIYWVYAIVAM